MRIDLFLHRIRLARSRTLAQSLVETGYVRIDGRRIEKPSEQVQDGSIVALPLQGKVRVIRILTLPARRGPPSEACACYEELEPDAGN